jgi:hypothetical protein
VSKSPLLQTDNSILEHFEKIVGITVPDFDRGSIIPPVLGPILGEHPMERYSRAFAVQKSLQNMASDSKKGKLQ